MIDTCVAATFLFLVIMVIRHFCRGKISNVVIYALWLVLAARLILPGVEYVGIHLFGMDTMAIASPVSIGNAQYALEKAWNQKVHGYVQKEAESARKQKQVAADREQTSGQAVVDAKKQSDPAAEQRNLSVQGWNVIMQGLVSGKTAYGIWLIGFVVILMLQIRMEHRMRSLLAENREQMVYQGDCIYRTKGITTPLLFRSKGLTLDIYVPDALAAQAVMEEQKGKDSKSSGKIALLEHAILHEKVHMRHGDIWWGYLRNLLVAIYWFHPVVWLAAILSKRDCEYACDDAVMRRMNDEERIAYGNSLLMLVQVGRGENVFLTATTMKMKTSEMRTRIQMIKSGIRKRRGLLVLVIIIAAVAGVAAFTQGTDTNKATVNVSRSDTASQTIPPDRQNAEEAEKQLSEDKARQDEKVQQMTGVKDADKVQESSEDAQRKQEEIGRLVGKEQQAAAEHSVPDWYTQWESEHKGDDGMLEPEEIHDVQEIFLYKDNTTRSVRDEEMLAIFEKAFSEPVEEIKGGSACPFTQTVYIRTGDGICGKVLIATDSCSIYSTGDHEYKYYWDIMEAFWKQFGIYYWE
ncbi:MAG: hypothetical protein J6A03_10905 [Lachnospiraceae bacterium]|nr:hypothetical protein [Lachnospiraceae bacterium]